MKIISKSISLGLTLTVAGVIAATSIESRAQGIVASATLIGLAGTGNTFNYTITLNNAANATTPIEGFWYAWIPGQFFLPTTPSSAGGGTAEWAPTIVSTSIQYQGDSSDAIQPGHSATLTFVSTDTPAALAGMSGGFPIGDSVAYPGTINFSDTSPNQIVTVASVAPEPRSMTLLIAGALGWLFVGRRKLRGA